jgi:hypothetical protein
MTTSVIVFMAVIWSAIISTVLFCYYGMLAKDRRRHHVQTDSLRFGSGPQAEAGTDAR